MIPFVYLVGWSTAKKYYYGVRYARGCNPSDLWNTYFTSSKRVAQLRILHGEPDIVEVRKTFQTQQQAVKWELTFIRRAGLCQREDFLNRNHAGMIILTKEEQIAKGKKVSETKKSRVITPWNKGLTKENDSRVAKNAEGTKVTRGKRSWKGIPKPSGFGIKISSALKGRSKSMEHKLKLSEATKRVWQERRLNAS